MRTLLSKLIQNRTIKHKKRICIDQEFNKKLSRHMMNQKIGIIAFLVLCLIGVIAVLAVGIGSIFGVTAPLD